jgi:hypothetical protein
MISQKLELFIATAATASNPSTYTDIPKIRGGEMK